MKMKKTFAGIIASIVAISAMATSVSAAETSKTFDTYTVDYQAKYVVSGQATDTDTNEAFTLTLDEITGTAFDTMKVTSLTIDGTKYTEATTIDLYCAVNKVAKTVVVTPVTLAAGKAISVTVEITTPKTTKTLAEADVNLNKTVDVTNTKLVGNTGLNTTTTAVVGKVAASLVTDKKYLGVSYATAGDDITSVDLDGKFNGLVSTIANQIGANKGAKLVVNFKDMATAAAAGDSTPSYNQTITFSSASTEDFGIMLNNSSKLTKAAAIDKTKMTVTFDWDTVLKDSSITNATGNVHDLDYLAKNELAKTYTDSNGVKQYKYVITGFTVIVPDQAPAVVTTTTAPAVTTTAAPAANTTVPNATQPKTGSAAPVALAIIPVALAAAFVAKKKA